MTVVAYRDGVLVADGRTTSKSMIEEENVKKIWRLKDGSLIGASGDTVQCEAFRAYLVLAAKKKEKKLPPLRLKSVEGLLVSPEGDLWWFGGIGWLKLKLPYYAIGSGYVVALAAMDAGATAREAVNIACKRVTSCGGRITELHLKGK